MGFPGSASHLGTHHAVGCVRMAGDEFLVDRFRESRPSATRIVLVCRREERLAGRNIHIDAFPEFMIILVGERMLSGCLLCDGILFGGQSLA